MAQANFTNLRNIKVTPRGEWEMDMVCPRCGAFSPSHGPQLDTDTIALSCYRCKRPVMVIFEGTVGQKVIDYYPKRSVTVDAHVPSGVADDYLEAQRCFLVGAWHGCAVMARRCMHSVAERLNAVGGDLYEQINDLKNRQIITPVLAEQAQHVRVLGKHGAHPFDTKGNQLKELGLEDAQAALEFCDFIFDQVFIQPKKIEASKARLKPETPTP